jgi:hypothetical protein
VRPALGPPGKFSPGGLTRRPGGALSGNTCIKIFCSTFPGGPIASPGGGKAPPGECLNETLHQQIVVARPSAKDVAADLLTELRSRFERIMDINSDQFNPNLTAPCLLDSTVAAVMLIPVQAPLLHSAKQMIIRLCEAHCTAMAHSSVSGATGSHDSSKGKANRVKKYSYVANKIIQSANATSHSSHSTEKVQGQLNRCMSELTESNFNIDNGLEFWQNRLTTNKLIAQPAQDLLSAPASQTFVERIFSLCELLSAGRRNRMLKSMEMRALLKLNKHVL